jgi:hypothetical protein
MTQKKKSDRSSGIFTLTAIAASAIAAIIVFASAGMPKNGIAYLSSQQTVPLQLIQFLFLI